MEAWQRWIAPATWRRQTRSSGAVGYGVPDAGQRKYENNFVAKFFENGWVNVIQSRGLDLKDDRFERKKSDPFATVGDNYRRAKAG